MSSMTVMYGIAPVYEPINIPDYTTIISTSPPPQLPPVAEPSFSATLPDGTKVNITGPSTFQIMQLIAKWMEERSK